MEQELCVCEMMFVLSLAQSRLSHQLRILRDAGLVEDTRDGQWIIYRIPAKVRAVVAPLLALFPRPQKGGTDEAEADRKKLAACLKKEVRKKRCQTLGGIGGHHT
jgi:ArsR family transcriptional regulator